MPARARAIRSSDRMCRNHIRVQFGSKADSRAAQSGRARSQASLSRPLDTWSTPLKPGYRGIEVIPRLSACHPEIRLRPKPTGIVQTRSPYGEVLHRGRGRRKQRRAAGGTELPFRDLAAVSYLLKMRGLALRQLHGAACHDQGGRKATSAGELAVAAMAIEHSEWQRQAFIADSATRAAAGEWNCHGARQVDAQQLHEVTRPREYLGVNKSRGAHRFVHR